MSETDDDLREVAWLESQGKEQCIWCHAWTADAFHEDECREAPWPCHGMNCQAVRPRATLQDGLCEACVCYELAATRAEEAGNIAARRPCDLRPEDPPRMRQLLSMIETDAAALRQYGRFDLAMYVDDMVATTAFYRDKVRGRWDAQMREVESDLAARRRREDGEA